MASLPVRVVGRDRARRTLREVAASLPGWVWRLRHPGVREPFVRARELGAERLGYRTDDGWSGDVLAVPPAPGAPGEPVALLATLGLDPRVFHAGPSLVDALVAAGFAPYLVGHRAGGGAVPVEPDAGPVGFDEAATRDVAAALHRVAAHAGTPRVHVVGHGFGGLVALAHVASHGGRGLASLALLSSPARALGARAPLSTPGPWSPLVARAAPGGWAAVREPTVGRREALTRAVGVPRPVARGVEAWWRAGAVLDGTGRRELLASLGAMPEPLWLGVSDADRWCPPAAALAVRDAWRGGHVTVHRADGLDHLDLVVGEGAGERVHAPLVAWLAAHRWRAWRGELVHDVGC